MRTAWAIGSTTLGEALRKRILQIFLVVALALIVVTEVLTFISLPAAGVEAYSGASSVWANEMVLIRFVAFAIISLAGLVMSIFLGMDAIPTEIEKRTIYTILSKPVARASYIFGKFLGTTLTLFVNLGLMAVAFVLTVILKRHGLEWHIFVGIGLIFLQFMMLGALSLLFSILLTRNINVALTFFLFVIGSLSDYWGSVVRLTETGLKTVFQVLHVIIPNFGQFNSHNPLVNPDVLRQVPNYTGELQKDLLYGVGYTALLVLLAILAFERREV